MVGCIMQKVPDIQVRVNKKLWNWRKNKYTTKSIEDIRWKTYWPPRRNNGSRQEEQQTADLRMIVMKEWKMHGKERKSQRWLSYQKHWCLGCEDGFSCCWKLSNDIKKLNFFLDFSWNEWYDLLRSSNTSSCDCFMLKSLKLRRMSRHYE